MEERYPYIRFVIGAAPLIAGALAGVTLLGGTISACSQGGFAGFLSFLLSVVIAGVSWIAAMVWIESLQVFVDVEEHTRKLTAGSGTPPAAP